MPSGHPLSLSAVTIILLIFQNLQQICETKTSDTLDDKLDLIYSDTSHGPQTAAAHQQVVYIDHGGGAISQIRRTSFFPPSSVPSLPFGPHVEHYPNNLFENNIVEDPYINFPQDIPRIFERRNGPNQDHDHRGLQAPPVSFIPQNVPQPITPEIHQHIPPIPQPVPPFQHYPELHRITHPIPQSIAQPISQPLPQIYPQHIPQPISHPFPQPFGHQISQSLPELPIGHTPLQQPISQPFPQRNPQPIPQPIPPPETHSLPKPFRHPIDDIEDERFLINNEIERIPKPSNQIKPAKREPPPTQPPPPPPLQEPPINSFFDFNSPELFGGIDGGFDPFGPQIFQRRRLTTNTNAQDVNQNSIGYPPYAYYKGEDSPPTTNWPKIFKFTDGRSNLYEFEKQKKQNKIKFTSKETYFDHISRDSFLILHGGTYAQ